MIKQKPFWETGLNPITMTRVEALGSLECRKTPQKLIKNFRNKWNKNHSINELSAT
jgi:hypothetical protein